MIRRISQECNYVRADLNIPKNNNQIKKDYCKIREDAEFDVQNATFEQADRNLKLKNIESDISVFQVSNNALDEDLKILKDIKEQIVKTDFDSLSREERVNIQEDIISKIDVINKKSLSTKFEGKNLLDGSIEKLGNGMKLHRVDSQTLGLTVENVSKLKLDDIRVQGESYVPPYSFDISTVGGSSTALSVINVAISKINDITIEYKKNINELMQYPEILELDRSEYCDNVNKIHDIESARRIITKLRSSVSSKISETQNLQRMKKFDKIINSLIE